MTIRSVFVLEDCVRVWWSKPFVALLALCPSCFAQTRSLVSLPSPCPTRLGSFDTWRSVRPRER